MALHCERMAWPNQTLSCPPPDGWEALLEPAQTKTPLPQPAARKKDRRRPHSPKLRTLQVSSATARILRAGHPWVIRDGDTGDLGLFKRGDLAELVDPHQVPVATALIEPRASVCARVVASSDEHFPSEAPWESRALRAASRRARTIASADTDAYRVVHGEADGLPGLFIDRWGDVLVATRTTPLADSFRSVYPAILKETACTALWEQDHFEDLRSRGSAPSSASREGRWAIGSRSIDRWTVLECGLRYLVEPTAGLTHGLYTDQRTNREMLRRLIEDEPSTGSYVANLFSHTAAFSVACAAAGASKVVSVDLARRYSEWAAQNLALNGLSTSDHPVVAEGAMEWLRGAEGLSGVIIDPPGHARSKKATGMDWNARRDYRALVTAAAAALRPGGWLLCCLNLKGLKRDWLRREVEKGMQTANKKVSGSIAIAPPSPDHPRRKGFPEGRAFHGLFVRTES
jgi:23S rRNA (cytosine1962-C5)-methyltransferase